MAQVGGLEFNYTGLPPHPENVLGAMSPELMPESLEIRKALKAQIALYDRVAAKQ